MSSSVSCVLLSFWQKKEAEEVRQNCETLNNVLLAEFDYFSRVMVDDFESMMAQFLRQQADFHRHVSVLMQLNDQQF